MKKNYVILILTILLLALLPACTPSQSEYESSLRMVEGSMDKDTQNKISEGGVLAAYYNEKKDYYCVSTYGRTEKEIASLEKHEVCHALIKQDPIHFCGGNSNEA